MKIALKFKIYLLIIALGKISANKIAFNNTLLINATKIAMGEIRVARFRPESITERTVEGFGDEIWSLHDFVSNFHPLLAL